MSRLPVFCLALLIVAACTSPSPTPSSTAPPTPTPSPSATPAATLPAPGTQLNPGVYQGAAGNVGIRFGVGPGWTYEQEAPAFFDIEQDPGSPDVVAVQFAGVGDTARQAETVLGEIEAQDDLVVSERELVTIGCLGMTRVTVQTTDPADTDPAVFRPVVTIQAGPLSIASGRRLQVNIFDVHMGTSMILVGGSIRNWDQALAAAQPVLDSLELSSSGLAPIPPC